MKKLIIIIAIIFAAFSNEAQDFNHQKMDSLFAKIEANYKGMGSISIFRDGTEVYSNSIGFADIENGTSANWETVYRIGSVSKTFTAVIIMQLVEEKKIDLNTSLSNFFPEIPNAKKITVEQMLRHRSGLFNFTDKPDYTSWMEQAKTREQMLNIVAKNGTVFEPDEKSEYSNTNFLLLSYIAEDIENKSLAEILYERIVKPCSLKHTYYGGKINPEKNEARSYRKNADWKPDTETDMSIPSGAGAIVSTPCDLNTFYNCLFTGKLVSESSLQAMMDIRENFGMGLFTFPFYEQTAYGHTGGIDGFQSNVAWFPDSRMAIAYTANAVDMSVNDILIGVLSIYFGKDYKLPDFSPPIEVSIKEMDKYTGVYSAPDFPLKITVMREENTLMAQGSGQPAFPLEAFEKDKFRFDQAGLIIEFITKENKLILKQGGQVFEMQKE